jgi:hypothetical protein
MSEAKTYTEWPSLTNGSLNETALAHGSFDSSSIRKLLPAV